MARRFGRPRWRRPERMTLEHPPVVRRKDIGAPDLLALEPELAAAESHRRVAILLAGFLVLCAVLGAVVGLALGALVLGVAAALGLAVTYFVLVREFGDVWLRDALGASSSEVATTRRLVRAVARASGVPPPMVFTVPGEGANAIGLGLRQRWLAVTEGAAGIKEITQEGMLAHEIVRIRDGDAALASLYLCIADAPELLLRNLRRPTGLLLLLAVPLWPVSLVIRAARRCLFAPDHQHRADIAAAMITRYPPGVSDALRAAADQAHRGSGLRASDPLWFAPRTTSERPSAPERADLVDEM